MNQTAKAIREIACMGHEMACGDTSFNARGAVNAFIEGFIPQLLNSNAPIDGMCGILAQCAKAFEAGYVTHMKESGVSSIRSYSPTPEQAKVIIETFLENVTGGSP